MIAMPSILGAVVRRALGASPNLVDIIEYQNTPTPRMAAIADTVGTRIHKLNALLTPRQVREESRGTSLSAEFYLKYDYLHSRLGGNTTAAAIEALDPTFVHTSYWPWCETQYHGSNRAQTGSGGRYSHGPYYAGLGPATIGGNPHGGLAGSDNGGAADNIFELYPGHAMLGASLTTTNSRPALTGPSDSVTYDFTGSSSNLVLKTSASQARILVIWTPAGNEWGDEEGSPNPWTDAEFLVITGLTSSSVIVKQLVTPGGELFYPMGSPGASLPHGVGSKMCLIGKGQSSYSRMNYRFNNSVHCPRDALNNTFNEFIVTWYSNNHLVNSSGAAVNIGEKAQIASDVNDTFLAFSDRTDIDGDGIRDDGYTTDVNGHKSNEHRAGQELLASIIAADPVLGGKPIQPGGVNEEWFEFTTAHQTESLDDHENQQDIDENTKFHEVATKLDRSYKFHALAPHPHATSVVNKTWSKYLQGTGQGEVSNQNNAVLFKATACAMFDLALAVRDVATAPDPWLQWMSVIADPSNLQGQQLGQAIENTGANQTLLRANKHWLGPFLGPAFNFSGVDLDDMANNGLNLRLSQKFQSGHITNTGGWVLGGNNKGNSTLSYDSVNGGLVVEDINPDPNYGGISLIGPSSLTSADDGLEYCLRIRYSSNVIGHVNSQMGENNVHQQKVFPMPGYVNEITIPGKFGTGEFGTSGNAPKPRFEIGRLNQKSVSNPYFKIHEIDLFTGTNAAQTAWMRYNHRGVTFFNATRRTLPYVLNGNFIVPNTTALHDCTWLTPGQTVSSGNIPPNCGAMLVRAADNYDSNVYEFNRNTNTAKITVPEGQHVNFGSYIDIGGYTKNPVKYLSVAA